MIEAHQNALNYTSLDCVRWKFAADGPDLLEFNLGSLGTDPAYSLPCAVHGMELVTFQAVLTPATPDHEVSLTLGFEVSQDGVHWDALPDSSFNPPLSSVNVANPPASANSQTYLVMTKSNYIRVVVYNGTEGGFETGETLRIFFTATEG
jgi:hypothetical protein